VPAVTGEVITGDAMAGEGGPGEGEGEIDAALVAGGAAMAAAIGEGDCDEAIEGEVGDTTVGEIGEAVVSA
jgi:hypothetical protein